VREAHRRTEPTLQAIPEDAGHHVACLLDHSVRQRIWGDLAAGRRPEEARAKEMGDAPPPGSAVTSLEGDSQVGAIAASEAAGAPTEPVQEEQR
jgi:hypothetical protein